MQKREHLVDLAKCWGINTWLQKPVSIQPRTELPKYLPNTKKLRGSNEKLRQLLARSLPTGALVRDLLRASHCQSRIARFEVRVDLSPEKGMIDKLAHLSRLWEESGEYLGGTSRRSFGILRLRASLRLSGTCFRPFQSHFAGKQPDSSHLRPAPCVALAEDCRREYETEIFLFYSGWEPADRSAVQLVRVSGVVD